VTHENDEIMLSQRKKAIRKVKSLRFNLLMAYFMYQCWHKIIIKPSSA